MTEQIILYLSYFYKHGELSVRLGFFWTASALTDVLGGWAAGLGLALLATWLDAKWSLDQ